MKKVQKLRKGEKSDNIRGNVSINVSFRRAHVNTDAVES